MAVKKPAAKKPAVKKPAAKKPAAKKPAVKKPAKKPIVKKLAVKKPAAKKPAAKKPAVKKPAAKKPAIKKAVAAVKKPVAAVKPAAKKAAAAVKKPAVKAAKGAVDKASKAPAVKKVTAAVKKPVSAIAAIKTPAGPAAPKAPVQTPESLEPHIKYRNLFDAYAQGKLPFAQGYIVSSFFSPTTAYSIYEIVSYAGVKEIFPTANGLQFVTGGKKLFVLVENDTYHHKPVEPVSRAMGESIPKRFNELEIIVARNQYKIMVAKEPNELYGSFTILKPASINFSIVFYQLPDVYTSITSYFENSLNRVRKVPEHDAKKAAQLIAATIKKHMSFDADFA